MDAVKLSLRIDLPQGTRFGPGKATLLRELHKKGSIRAAAESLSMSYPRALKLIEQMNDSFASPLVETQHGGAVGGGATVTAAGLEVLDLYSAICEEAEKAGGPALVKLKRHFAE